MAGNRWEFKGPRPNWSRVFSERADIARPPRTAEAASRRQRRTRGAPRARGVRLPHCPRAASRTAPASQSQEQRSGEASAVAGTVGRVVSRHSNTCPWSSPSEIGISQASPQYLLEPFRHSRAGGRRASRAISDPKLQVDEQGQRNQPDPEDEYQSSGHQVDKHLLSFAHPLVPIVKCLHDVLPILLGWNASLYLPVRPSESRLDAYLTTTCNFK